MGRLYGNDAKEWPSKKVYEKTPRPTKWTPPNYGKDREWMKNWEKPTPKPTKYVKPPKPTSKKTDGRAYGASSEGMDDLTPLEKVLQAQDTLKAIEEKLRNGEGPEEGETRLYCDFFTQLLFPYLCGFI